MTNFIAIDAEGNVIQGIGKTEDEARRDALNGVGRIYDSEDNDLPEAEALATFRVYEATDALIAQVEDEGGSIAWGYMPDGTACTVEEEEGKARLLSLREGCESNGVDFTGLIRQKFNCEEAEMDNDGDVWIEGPQSGHWIDANARHELADWIEARA